MPPEIQRPLDQLLHALCQHSPETATAFHLYVTAKGHEVMLEHRTPDDLKAAGVSMRNLRRAWVRHELPNTSFP